MTPVRLGEKMVDGPYAGLEISQIFFDFGEYDGFPTDKPFIRMMAESGLIMNERGIIADIRKRTYWMDDIFLPNADVGEEILNKKEALWD